VDIWKTGSDHSWKICSSQDHDTRPNTSKEDIDASAGSCDDSRKIYASPDPDARPNADNTKEGARSKTAGWGVL
jgi:hypothetical protein